MKKKSVTVLGWYGKTNIGDESYKLAFPKLFPDYKFNFTDKLTPKIIAETDAVVVGGGDILSDAFLKQLATVTKPKHIISASATETTDIAKLEGFANVIIRDHISCNLLARKGVPVIYKPDVAFALECNRDRGRRILRKKFEVHNRELYKKVVVVILNGYLIDSEQDGYDARRFMQFQNLAYNIGYIADFTPASFVFLPFGQSPPWDDRVPNAWASQRCKFWKKNLVVWNQQSVQSALDIIGAADAVISTRLHSTIFSMATGTPFIDITHNHKNTALLTTTEKMHYSIPYEAFDADKTLKLLKGLLERPDDAKKELQTLLDKQRELLRGLSDVRLV
jgi:polysaccharide pyruvyl transferase WcaK-like protein